MYRAEVIEIKDGDTFVANIDLGFGIWLHKQVFRMIGINAPEMKTAAGPLSKDALTSLILNKQVTLMTKKDGKEKYGRWLATVLLQQDNNTMDINQHMVAEGFAVKYKV
jgi:endonuclease YncB( thermonuclease family)